MIINERNGPTRLVANLFLTDQAELPEPPQDPRNIILVVEIAGVDTDQPVAVGVVLARRDLGGDAQLVVGGGAGDLGPDVVAVFRGWVDDPLDCISTCLKVIKDPGEEGRCPPCPQSHPTDPPA